MTFTRLPPLLASLLAATLLAGCGDKQDGSSAAAVDFDKTTACVLDGMLLANFPGPKAQIHYAGVAKPDYFCDTVEMFSVYLKPEQARRVTALYVQDMGKARWDEPQGNWIDARQAVYVAGSDMRGSMGPTFASFASEAAAQEFIKAHGGRLLKFADVKPEMAELDGGVIKDQKM
ncbi:MAG: nitrous oxide reductase accessory protein NosL [Rhodocyclaceae bacterium]|nr:nitrous oxide reductase accessory protein NosL [Rhodocyclaceae bacterium]MBX3668067.1 nitrous oxide reductase accessory protein NosL [Rhodocyclaceae bacterium]